MERQGHANRIERSFTGQAAAFEDSRHNRVMRLQDRRASSLGFVHLREDANVKGRPGLPWFSPKVRMPGPSTVPAR